LKLRKRKGRRVKIAKTGSQHELQEKLPTGSAILPSDGTNKLLITEKDISTLGPGRPAIRRRVELQRLAALGTTTLDRSKMTTEQLDRMLYELESGEPS
jgi:hypothetical protein